MTFRLQVRGCPYPWRTPQRARGQGTYKHPRLEAWQGSIALQARAAFDGPPLECPVRLTMTLFLERPKSHYLSSGRLRKGAPHHATSKKAGDLTNHEKAVEDALTGILWVDDSQVVEKGRTAKFYAGPSVQPGVLIEVEEVG